MAILLTDSGTLIQEPIKCGTTWLREALTTLHIPWRDPEPVWACCRRHSPWWCYRPAPLVVALVRRPDEWLRSVYAFHRGTQEGGSLPLPWVSGKWYAQRAVLGECVPSTFAAFLEALEGGCVSRYFDAFTGPAGNPCVGMTLRQESLAADLAVLLGRLGRPVASDRLQALPRVNVTEGPAVCWPEGAREAVLASESYFLARWYADG